MPKSLRRTRKTQKIRKSKKSKVRKSSKKIVCKSRSRVRKYRASHINSLDNITTDLKPTVAGYLDDQSLVNAATLSTEWRNATELELKRRRKELKEQIKKKYFTERKYISRLFGTHNYVGLKNYEEYTQKEVDEFLNNIDIVLEIIDEDEDNKVWVLMIDVRRDGFNNFKVKPMVFEILERLVNNKKIKGACLGLFYSEIMDFTDEKEYIKAIFDYNKNNTTLDYIHFFPSGQTKKYNNKTTLIRQGEEFVWK